MEGVGKEYEHNQTNKQKSVMKKSLAKNHPGWVCETPDMYVMLRTGGMMGTKSLSHEGKKRGD